MPRPLPEGFPGFLPVKLLGLPPPWFPPPGFPPPRLPFRLAMILLLGGHEAGILERVLSGCESTAMVF